MIIVTDISSFAPDAHGIVIVRVVGTKSRQTSMWTRCRVRKNHECVRCRKALLKGEKAYRTVENADYRMKRLCETCVERAILERIAFCELCEDRGDPVLTGSDCRNCDHGIYEEMSLKPCHNEECMEDTHHFGLGAHLIPVRDL